MQKIKIAIIGAGPSGFGAAEALRSRDMRENFEFTMYERNDYVGGKCCTVDKTGTVTNGKGAGYEMGATIIAKHTPNYHAVSQLLQTLGTPLTPFREQERGMFRYVKRGKNIPIQQIGTSLLTHQPKRFLQALGGYEEYAKDYVRYSLIRSENYTNRPKVLAKNLSKLYDKAVYTRFAGIMQGFGYADLDDRHLTPPALYYHQYIEPSVLEFPTYIVDHGTQSIWHTLSDTYPANSVCLNQTVRHIERHADYVRIRTNTNVSDYDYVIIATPLKPALEFLDTLPHERAFLSKMKHNHYVSVLCRTDDLHTTGIFNLPACTQNKRLGEVVFAYQRYPDSDYVVAYLYIKNGAKSDDQTIINATEKSLKKDFGINLKDKQSAKVFHWDDYFGHLDTETIQSGWYEEFDKFYQGQNRTLFVSSGLHMETVGASFQYGKETTEKYIVKWLEGQLAKKRALRLQKLS